MLVTPAYAQSYTVSLVAVDGKVVASAQAKGFGGALTCGGIASAVLPPPISTSDSRVYYMDAQGVVSFLTPQGETGRAATLPTGGARRSMFAVSPDDTRIAVVVSDFTATGASTRLYVDDLASAAHHLVYSQTGSSILWPTGWHGGSLVLAKVPACTQGGGPFCCGPQEFHLVDPATAIRRFTVGSSSCVLAGPPSKAGVVCEVRNTFAQANVVDWTAVTRRSFPIQGPTPALISPDGRLVALVPAADTAFDGTSRTFAGLQACGWIDDGHVFTGGDAQHQPRIGDISTGAIIPISAQGDCAGRVPGGL